MKYANRTLILLVVLYSWLNSTKANVGFSLGDTEIPNHGLVYFEDIGVDRNASDLSVGLACWTNATSSMCCEDVLSSCGGVVGSCSTGTGNWIFPQLHYSTSGNWYIRRQVDRLAGDSDDGYGIHREGNAVYLFHDKNIITVHSGLWRCIIPDTSGIEQTLFIGIYPQQETSGTITTTQNAIHFTHISENPLMLNLTLNTSGGPATYVTWTRDGVDITTLSDMTYSTYRQPLIDQDTGRGYRDANYTNTLTVTGRHPGVYEVNVTNDRNDQPVIRNFTIIDTLQPTNLNVTRSSYTSLHLQWNPPPVTSVITGYNITNKNCTQNVNESECTEDSIIVDATTTYVDYHNIKLWQLYNINITVISLRMDVIDDGYYTLAEPLVSTSGTFTRSLPGLIPPVNVLSELLHATSVIITWSHTDQGLSVDEYIVSYQRINGTDGQCSTYQHEGMIVSNENTSTLLHGLEEFSVYVVSITVRNNHYNVTNQSALFEVITHSTAPTGPPQNLAIMNMTTTSITITWESVECIHRNGLIIQYSIIYGPTSSKTKTLTNSAMNESTLVSNDNTSFVYTTTDVHIVPYQQYTFRVAAINANGTGPYSEIQTVKGVYSADNVSSQPLNATSVMVTWTHPDQGLSVDEYIVSYQRINGTDGQCSTYQDEGNVSVDQNTHSHTLQGLKEYSVYKISVTAKNLLFNATSDPISDEFETLSAAPTGTPQILAYTSYNVTSVTITWNSVECMDRNGLITHYIVVYEEIGGSIILSMNLTVNGTNDGGTFIINDLEPDIQYQVNVSAANENGTGPIARLNINYILPGTTTEPDSTGSDMSTAGSSTGFTATTTSLESDVSTTGTNTGFAVIVVLVSLTLAVTAVIIVAITVTVYRKRKQKKNNSGSDGDINLSTNETNNLELTSRGTYKNMYEPTLEKKASCSVAHTEIPMIKKFPEDIHVTEGQEVVLEVTVSGQPEPSLTWYHNGEELVANYSLEIDQDGRVYIPSSELRHSGVYKLVVKNSCGSDEREMNLCVHVEGEMELTSQEEIDLSPVPVSEFGVFVAKHHEDFNAGFRATYQGLYKGEDHTTKISLSPANKKLNRFRNITVYDDNRIELKSDNGFNNTFVNACYVDGYGVPHKYIATQGPLPHTVSDFWRLVWQEKVPTIVMVTNLKEGDKVKCHQYWPDSGSQVYGPVEVTTSDQQILAHYIIRTLFVKLHEECCSQIKVTQYHFTSWPDHGVPTYATSVLVYHRRVKAEHEPRANEGPITVS